MFHPSPAVLPPTRTDPADPRWLELRTPDAAKADLLVAGIPYDGAVIGRKGARDGPTGIREAFRFVASNDPGASHHPGPDLKRLRWHDLGDVAGLEPSGADVLATHAKVRSALAPAFLRGKPLVALGGDNSLSFPVVQALLDSKPGRIGVVVLDAHYDLRSWSGQPTSGTPYLRMLDELDGRLRPGNLAEVGIRPFANTSMLADVARLRGVHVHTTQDVARRGIHRVAADALRAAARGVDHVWLSVDIDGLDQSIATGCSAPGMGGLTLADATHLVRTVARHPKCRGMDLAEVAPSLDLSGKTTRTAAQLVAQFAAGVAQR